MQAIDRRGQRFGRLEIIERADPYKHESGTISRFRCRCDCGRETIVMWHNLRTGRTRSCGCLVKENSGRRAVKWKV